MRVERVIAHAFGPFSGESLDLAPGLTVVGGPNESGKSTWHAAIRAGTCGVRRGRGAGTKADAAFEDRHRPWDGDGRWEVEVRLALDDGRTIDVTQDLAGKVACRATDVVLGRDVSDEIMDGTPDASRWLGLDRDAFAATICVNQAQIAAIAGRETAASLQEHMQRAAATRGTDATAAEARGRLEEFRREQVGVDRANARGPLRSARVRLDAARTALDAARAQHDAYLDATARAEAADRVAARLASRAAAVEAALAGQAAAELARRASRAAKLSARHPFEPAGAAARDTLADQVAGALDAWRSRPTISPLGGATAAELAAELAALPPPPAGDTAPHPSVIAARRALDLADEAIGLLGPRPGGGGVPSADAALARDLARRLRTPEPAPTPELDAELRDAVAAAGRPDGEPRSVGIVAAVLATMVAVAAFAAGLPIVGVALLVVAAAIGAWSVRGGRAAAQDARQERLARAHAALAPIAAAREHARSERAAATAEAAAAGLPADADELDRIAAAADEARRAAADAEAWEARRSDLSARRSAAAAGLRDALAQRGAGDGDDVAAAVAGYEADCRERAAQAMRAGSRPALEGALAARRSAEAAADEAARAVERAVAALRSASEACGLPAEGEPESLASGLETWRARRSSEAERLDAARREWHELATLLDGRSLDDLRDEADRAAARAGSLAARLEPSQLDEVVGRDDLASLLEVEREEAERARADAASQHGALAEIGRELADVAEAEEAFAEAGAELDRVTGLAATIDETLRLLRAAEERVHRDLAPVLADGIGRWLPRVSGGAYADASVDPADLSVRVKEAATGRWRSALLLSEGTREQIYLLLRAAMAQRLATTGETAPLLLDEPTAQADAERKRQLLGVLHELSRERQIVLFTHDDDVVAWAAEALDVTRDRLVGLGARRAIQIEASPALA